MKIVRIRVRDVAVPRIYETHCADPDQMQSDVDHARSRYQIIELFTENGLTGLGEVSDIARRMNALPSQALEDLLSEIMLGGNLDRWRDLYGGVQAALPDHWHPELRSLTLFGVEIALLDLVGRRYEVPVYELLGGRYRDCVQVSWVAFLRGKISATEELDRLRVEIMEKAGRGLRSFKLKVGEDHARDLERVSLVRRLAGPEAYIKVDASGAWEETEAIDKVEDMAEAGANACETPVIAVSRPIANDDPQRINNNADAVAATLGRVRAASSIDIIEHVADLGDEFSAALVRHRAVDVINVVASQAGGLLRSQRLIQTAETAGIPALLGSTIELGPGTAAFVHLAIASRNVTVPSDLVSPELLVDDICRNPLRFQNGTLQPYNAPGLGMEIDEDKMERFQLDYL